MKRITGRFVLLIATAAVLPLLIYGLVSVRNLTFGTEQSVGVGNQEVAQQIAAQIKLYFDTQPEMKLRQWVITDAQGLATTVTINDIVPGRKVAADFFTSTTSFQPFR